MLGLQEDQPSQKIEAPIAYAAAVMFVGLFVTYGIAPTSPVVSLFGIPAHLLLFPIVAALGAPSWAKAAGYGWLVVDIVSNVMSLSGIGDASTSAVRFGGHVVAALWIASASWGQDRVTRVVGSLLALILFVTAVGNPWLPGWLFAFAMPLLPLWLVLVGCTLSSKPVRAYSPVDASAGRGPTPQGNATRNS